MTKNTHDFKQDFNYPTKQHQDKEKSQSKALEFFGKSQNCAVFLVDVVNTTKLTTKISESQKDLFYSTLLELVSDVVTEYNGTIVKSIDDAVLFYFDESDNDYMRNALRCGTKLIERREQINEILNAAEISSIDYRVSGDFGKVMVGYSADSAAKDIFGPVVNMCSKINLLANSNEMVIGDDFHMIIKSSQDFQFSKIRKDGNSRQTMKYSVYRVRKM